MRTPAWQTRSARRPDVRVPYPLHVAAEFGQSEAARLLLRHGAELSLLDAENAAITLGWAAFFGRPGVVVALLAAGSEPSQRNKHDLMPLACALGGAQGGWKELSNASAEEWQKCANHAGIGKLTPIVPRGVRPSARALQQRGECRPVYRPSNQGIDRFRVLEAAKVAIIAPQNRYTVLDADGGDAGIMELTALQLGLAGKLRQDAPVLRAAVQNLQLRGRQPGVDLRQRLVGGAGWAKYLWVGDDGHELMQTTYRNAPALRALGKGPHALIGLCMEG